MGHVRQRERELAAEADEQGGRWHKRAEHCMCMRKEKDSAVLQCDHGCACEAGASV